MRHNVKNARYALETINKFLVEANLEAQFRTQIQHTTDRLRARVECFQSMINASPVDPFQPPSKS